MAATTSPQSVDERPQSSGIAAASPRLPYTDVTRDEEKQEEEANMLAAAGLTPAVRDEEKEEEARRIANEQNQAETNNPTVIQPTSNGILQDPARPVFIPYEKLAQKDPSPWDHLAITIGPPMIIFFDIVVPCIIYYIWYDVHRHRWETECRPYSDRGEICPTEKPEYEEEIMGWAIASFGFGEVYILLARVWRLLKFRDQCAPLLSRSKWELDATSWVYLVAMIMALIPFVIGARYEIPELYLYSPSFLMAFLGILMVITLIPFKIPIGVNSHARGSPCRPFIYYAAEDFIAVDGLQDREFRVRYNERYDTSRSFRRMFIVLTFWWIWGVMVFIGCVSAVIWKLQFHHAFGSSLGVLFAYIVIWAGTSVLYINYDMERQRKAHEALAGKC